MKKNSTFFALFVFLSLGAAVMSASANRSLSCPAGTTLCQNAIRMCCSICDPDPLAVSCGESLLEEAISFYEPANDVEDTLENLVIEFKNNLGKQIQNDHLRQCVHLAFDVEETFPEFLKALQEDPVKELAHLFVQLKPHSEFDNKHPSCHNSAFDAISINHIFKNIEDKLFLLYSIDYLRDYLQDIGGTKMSIVNLARALGNLLGTVIQEYLELTKKEPVMTQEYVDYLNTIQTSWTAGLYKEFADMNRQQLKRVAGSHFHRELHGPRKPKEPTPELEQFEWPSWWPFGGGGSSSSKTNTTEEDLKDNFPANFRVGENWPGCESAIKNQLKCDGCWAFSAVGIMNDRFCIVTGGKVKVDLSPQYILDCAVGASGCGGGNTDAAWRSFTLTGTPTWDCIPFEGKFRACGQDRLCADGSAKHQYYASENYTLGSKRAIKEELMKNGSVQASFKLFDDFFAYKTGLYISTQKFDIYTPEHAIRIVGWGIENGVEYWMIANSFGEGWGLNGYVKFKMEQNNIEVESYAGTPDLERSEITL